MEGMGGGIDEEEGTENSYTLTDKYVVGRR